MSVRIRITPEAEAQAESAAAWWRGNRPGAPALFGDELAGALTLLSAAPEAGPRYRRRGVPGLRRLLLPRTRYHVYYLYDAEAGVCMVAAVWGAVRGRGPRV